MPGRTFEQHWQQRCESEWRRSFMLFTLGVPSFLLQLILASWIKFDAARYTAITMTVIILSGIPYWQAPPLPPTPRYHHPHTRLPAGTIPLSESDILHIKRMSSLPFSVTYDHRT